ncbi:MAG: M20/M25/M40 family metallo-hydrolase, partial [Gemmatimonadales bacterium]
VEQYLKDLAVHEEDPRRRAWLAKPELALADPEAVAWLTADRYVNALLRNTVSLTGMTGSNAANLIPPLATAEVDVRLLPGQDPDLFLAEFRRVLDDDDVEIERLNHARPTSVPPFSGPVVDAVREAVDSMDPGVPGTTQVMTGYSDSCHYRELGIAAYGLDPFRTTPEDLAGIHGNDERVSLENIRFGIEFFYRIVSRLCLKA